MSELARALPKQLCPKGLLTHLVPNPQQLPFMAQVHWKFKPVQSGLELGIAPPILCLNALVCYIFWGLIMLRKYGTVMQNVREDHAMLNTTVLSCFV